MACISLRTRRTLHVQERAASYSSAEAAASGSGAPTDELCYKLWTLFSEAPWLLSSRNLELSHKFMMACEARHNIKGEASAIP